MKKLGILAIFTAIIIKIYMGVGFKGVILLGLAFIVIGEFLSTNNIEISIAREEDDEDDFWED